MGSSGGSSRSRPTCSGDFDFILLERRGQKEKNEELRSEEEVSSLGIVVVDLA